MASLRRKLMSGVYRISIDINLIYTHIYIPIRTHTYIHIHTYRHTHIRTHTHTHIYIYIYTHTYIHALIKTHTERERVKKLYISFLLPVIPY